LELNVLHEVILHDVIANKRLATSLGCWLDRKAAERMEEFCARWREFNLKIIQSAREASQVCPAERIYRGVEKGDLKLEEVRTVHPSGYTVALMYPVPTHPRRNSLRQRRRQLRSSQHSIRASSCQYGFSTETPSRD
jgi:hypothetical protein